MLFNLILTAWCAIPTAATVLTDYDLRVILSTFELLSIGTCVLVTDAQHRTHAAAPQEVRKLSDSFVLAGVMAMDDLQTLLENPKPPDAATAIVLMVKKPSVVKTLLSENRKRLHWFVWFLVGGEEELEEEVRIPFNCQFFQVKREKDGSRRLIENYQLKNSSMFRHEFGWWSPEGGMKSGSLNMYRRRTDFGGMELEITWCDTYDLERKLKMIWMEWARSVNFTIRMGLPRLNNTSEPHILLQDPDGSTCVWGVTGLDLDREWVFFHAAIKVKLAMKFRSSNDVGWRAYIKPFNTDMWKAIGVWLLLSTVAIVVVTGCNRKNLYLNVLTAFFCLCNSDPMSVHPPDAPIPLMTKLVYLMALIVPSVMVPAYSAYVLSTLSIVLPLEPFRDLKGLRGDGTYKVTAVNNTFAVRYLRTGRDPDLKYVYNNLFVGSDNAPTTYSEMFDQLCGDSKMVGLFPYSPTIQQLFRCRMYVIPQEMTTISSGIHFPKNSPLRKIFGERYNEYFEKGMLRDKSLVESRSYNYFGEEEDDLGALNLSQMGPIILLVPVGLVLSLVVLAGEIAVYERARRRPNHRWQRYIKPD